MSNLQAAALTLAQRGLHVFPCAPRGKIPLTKHGCLDASAEADQIRAWWDKRPDANIGIATGSKSGVWALDIDGDDGEASLRDIEQRMKQPLPATVESITGGGGRHLFFRLPDADEAPIIKNSAKQLGNGLDVRGDGGYVIAPPSIHPSGRKYCWSVDSASEFADPPVWLVALLEPPKVADLDERRPREHWRGITHEGAAEGCRNATAASLTGYLLSRGVDAHVTLDLVLAWNRFRNRPPLPDNEILHVVRSITERELKR
jgi:hypothetical protein